MNYNQEHTACIRWNKVVSIQIFTSKEKKGIVTLESLIPSCWSLIPTKLLLMPNKNTFLIIKSSTSFSLFLFTYSSLLVTLTTTTCSSSLKPILFFPTSFIPTQEGKPFTLHFRSNFPPSLFILLFYTYFTRPSTNSLYLLPHLPLNGTTPENLCWRTAATN